MMRTTDQIIQRIRDRAPQDFLGFEISEYLPALPKSAAESFRGDILKPDADLSDWEQALKTDEDVREKMIDYMPFAWDKANNCRGISACRSLQHYVAWLWLLGEDWAEKLEYCEYYGKPGLVKICEFLGIDPNQWDDGIRTNGE